MRPFYAERFFLKINALT